MVNGPLPLAALENSSKGRPLCSISNTPEKRSAAAIRSAHVRICPIAAGLICRWAGSAVDAHGKAARLAAVAVNFSILTPHSALATQRISGDLLRMEDELLSRALRVIDERTAAALGDPMLRRLTLGFIGRARSLSEVAASSGLELKRLHYHVTRLCRLGLLEVVGERPRRGRAIKLYRATAESFFISSDVAADLFTEPLSRELREAIRLQQLKAGGGMLLYTAKNGEPIMRPVADEASSSTATELWKVLRLDAEEAVALREDLRGLLDRYAAQSSARGKPYLIHAALARRKSPTVSVDNAKR
jgi:hypothetical protein